MQSPRARRTLEFLDYCSISIGMALACSGYAMLGGLFGLSAGGAPLILGIVAAGLLCILISLSIGELASMFPSAPGVRTYLKAAFGDRGSHSITLLVLLMVVLFAGVESYYCTATLHALVPAVSPYLLVTVIIGGVVLLNLAGLELPRRIHVVLVCLLLAVVIGTAIFGLRAQANLAHAPVVVEQHGALRFAATVGGAVFIFTGFEWVTPLGRSPAAYRRLVPWSMPLALAILTVTFALLGAAIDRHFAASAITTEIAPHVRLGAKLLPALGASAMICVSFFSMFSAFNAGLMGSARLVYALAREKRFPAWGAKLSSGAGIPIGGILLIGGLSWLSALLVLQFSLYRAISLVCAGIYCFVYAFFAFAALRLRVARPDTHRPFRARVPALVQWLVATAMAVLGVAVLLSEPSLRLVTLASFAIAVAVSVGAAQLLRSSGTRRAIAPAAALIHNKDA
jgi:amino acid transporter